MRTIAHRIRRVWFCLIAAVCLLQAAKGLAAAPETPQNLQPAWLFGEIMLRWDEMPGATSYNVYRFDPTNNVWLIATNGLTSPRYREYTWEPATYTVAAVNADGESAAASPVETAPTGDPFSIYFEQWNSPMYDTTATLEWRVNWVRGADGMLEVGTTWT